MQSPVTEVWLIEWLTIYCTPGLIHRHTLRQQNNLECPKMKKKSLMYFQTSNNVLWWKSLKQCAVNHQLYWPGVKIYCSIKNFKSRNIKAIPKDGNNSSEVRIRRPDLNWQKNTQMSHKSSQKSNVDQSNGEKNPYNLIGQEWCK